MFKNIKFSFEVKWVWAKTSNKQDLLQKSKGKQSTIKGEGIDRGVDDGDESHPISSHFQYCPTLCVVAHCLSVLPLLLLLLYRFMRNESIPLELLQINIEGRVCWVLIIFDQQLGFNYEGGQCRGFVSDYTLTVSRLQAFPNLPDLYECMYTCMYMCLSMSCGMRQMAVI